MKRHLFLILSVILTGVLTPAFSVADQTPVISDIADAGVETRVVEQEVKVESAPVVQNTVAKTPVTQAPKASTTPVVKSPEPVRDSITIAGKTLSITTVSDTTVDSGNHVNRYKKGSYDGRFLYGHNSAGVFGGLKNLGVGATFKVTLEGVTHIYRIAKTVIFDKNVEKGTIELGDGVNYMGQVAKAKFGGTQYDLSIMTCHGKSLGGGDATQRFVIFANRIN
ncbi:hypothetical protein IKX64_03215 [Candidatus Saccharibacteria bacterium]|nr:hypothetical protein [Candidatus Saccharibacteria bacterium]